MLPPRPAHTLVATPCPLLQAWLFSACLVQPTLADNAAAAADDVQTTVAPWVMNTVRDEHVSDEHISRNICEGS